MPHQCPIYTSSIPKLCPIYASSIPKLCLKYAPSMRHLCLKYAPSMPRHALIKPRFPLINMSIMPQLCLALLCSTIPQLCLLPQLCLIYAFCPNYAYTDYRIAVQCYNIQTMQASHMNIHCATSYIYLIV